MDQPPEPTPDHPQPGAQARPAPSRLARMIERSILSSRWLLAPIYIGLVISLLMLVLKFAQISLQLVQTTLNNKVELLITNILSMIDLSLMGNLLIIVMFAGYENFVARFTDGGRGGRPDWMGRVSFGALKLKLMTSIVAIGAVHLLEDFMRVDQVSDRELGWSIGILLTFILTGALLAVMDRLGGSEN